MSLIARKYNGEIDWNIGALFKHYEKTYNLLTKYSYFNHNIKYVFGSFVTKWNSGRTIAGASLDFAKISNIIKTFNDLGVSARMTFSNHLLIEDDLYDEKCNKVLDYMNKANKETGLENGVILVSDMLTKYIRDNYPNLKLTSSLYKPAIETGFNTDNSNYYNRLSDIYDTVVVDTNKVKDNNISFLKDLQNKDKFEFIANNHCVRHCKNVAKHCEAVARMQLAIEDNNMANNKYWSDIAETCLSNCNAIYKKTGEQLVLSLEEINMLIDLGFKHFKIQGRSDGTNYFFMDTFMYIFDDDEKHIDFTVQKRPC